LSYSRSASRVYRKTFYCQCDRPSHPPVLVERMRTPPSVTCLSGAKVHRLCELKT